MQSKSLVSRFFSRVIAGALFAAIWALGAPAALAQEPPPAPDLKVVKTGEVLTNGKVKFTIVVTNDGDAPTLGTQFHLYDALPQLPHELLDPQWVWYEPPFSPNPNDPPENPQGAVGCNVYEGNAPNPDQESLECDLNKLGAGESYIIYVESFVPVDVACRSVENTASVYDPYPSSEDWDKLPVPATASGSTSLNIGLCDGRMTGGGSIFTKGLNKKGVLTDIRVTHGFELRCDHSDHRQNLEINWANPGGNQNNFHLTKLTTAECSDDPAIVPNPPKAGFDTFYGEGEGTCNGKFASIVFTFTDAGEPGTSDTADYLIDGDDDACDLDAPEAKLIKKGNQQAHKN